MPIPESRDAADQTTAHIANETSAVLNNTVAGAINTAMAAKSNTTTINVTGKSAADVLSVMSELNRKGYKTSLSGSVITAKW